MGFLLLPWIHKIIGIVRTDSGLAYIGIGNLVSSAIGAAFWFFVASIIIVDDYGKLNYYISIASMLSIISLLGLNTTVITFLAKGAKRIEYQANLVVVLTNAVVAIVLLLITNLYTSLLLIGMSFFSMTIAEILGKQLHKHYLILVGLERGSQIGLALILYYLLGLQGIVLGYALGALIFSFRFFGSLKYSSFEIGEIRSKFTFTVHSYIFNISQSLTNNADKLIIGPLFGFATLGLYQLGFQFLLFLGIIPASLFQYLLPRFSKQSEPKMATYIGFIMAGISAIVLFFCIPSVLITFFPKYVEGITGSQIMTLGVIPMTANSILNSKLLGKEQSKYVLIGAAVYSSSFLGLSYFLGGLLGLTGLGVSLVISLLLQTLTLYVASKIKLQ